ncbi:MAG: glycosyltransferase [Planctomycetota bacterium]|nr:MAG: glycosyltransferase [Planctomycetota bacterium]
MNAARPEWTIVVPVYNEEPSLRELVQRIRAVAERESATYEVLLVDDGSTDGSWETIEALANADPQRIRGVRFRRNFGKAAALEAGFSRASGRVVITMDADLQDDPAEIPRLVARLAEGFDVVSGWKKVRHDPWHKVLPSRVFNWMISRLTGVQLHDHNCGLKAYRREVLDEVHIYGEMHRFIPVLAAARGFRVTEIAIQHHPRQHGKSKYGVERFIKGFLDLMTVYFLTGYGNRPQHLLGSLGLISLGLGMLGLLGLTAWWIVSRLTPMPDVHLHSRAMFYYCIVALLFGGQLVSVGFLAEMILAQNRDRLKLYSVAAETTPPGQRPIEPERKDD